MVSYSAASCAIEPHVSCSLVMVWCAEASAPTFAALFHFGNASALEPDGTGLLTAPFEVPASSAELPGLPHTETMSALIPGTPQDSYAVFSVFPSMRHQGTRAEVRSLVRLIAGAEAAKIRTKLIRVPPVRTDIDVEALGLPENDKAFLKAFTEQAKVAIPLPSSTAMGVAWAK